MKFASVVASPCLNISLRRLLLALAAGLGLCCSAQAGFLVVPNGDFSTPANTGSVGGGVIGASGTDVPIGSGPWTGTYNGVLGLLAPPTLVISSAAGEASISGLLGISVIGIVNNGGHFGQVLTATWQANKRYTLIANLRTDVDVDLPLLATAGTGISLNTGATLVASSTGVATDVRSDAVDALTLRIALTHDTAAAPGATGIGVQLFDRPAGLLTGGLIDTAAFSDVLLAQTTIPPAGSTLEVSGIGSQTTAVGMPFPGTMRAIVRDADGNPVPDVLVTLTAPPEGASATLHGNGQSGRTIVTFTDASGEVTLNATANEIAGCYKVTGTVVGVPGEAVFRLRNFSEEQIAAYQLANPGAMGTPQDSIYCNGFE